MSNRAGRRIQTLKIWMVAGIAASLAAPEGGADAPTLHIEPAECLLDAMITIRAENLPPAASVEIRSRTNDARGRAWVAAASLTADPNGRIDLSEHAPTEGSYDGMDPLGLIWSAQLAPDTPESQRKPARFEYEADRSIVTNFELVLGGRTVAHADLSRRAAAENLHTARVREDGLVGDLFLPPGDGPFPALLVLTGSGGGQDLQTARLLASHGFAAFAAAYFNAPGLPDKLIKIPLETPERALRWLQKHPAVDANRIGVIGASKGGELALLIAARFPDLRAVVAYVPSHVVWEGISGNPAPVNASSWTWRDEEITYVPYRANPAFFMQFATGRPVRLLALYEPSLENEEAAAAAAIPVEKISGPVLLVSGRDDQMWPSARMCEEIMARLRAGDFRRRFEHLSYDDAGHAIGKLCIPAASSVANERWTFGGTPAGNARAAADSWPKVRAFLHEALAGP